MKTQTNLKGRVPAKMNAQQVTFELKRKVVLALNKLADRDTYQIGFDELEKTAEFLTPDMILPFLSCILDTDSEQKSAVRKECIRLMGILAKFHESIIGQHLGKMVSSIVKRLKDPDSVVRDACVETVGTLASKLSNQRGESDEVFVMLVKPIFEALGEQNRPVQSGSALCLARIIDNAQNPPASILQRMLTRTTKLLKNPHFMAKPALIDLNRSIIQAGGASNQNVLSAAMVGIQEALKNSDWATRKAASVALGEIAATSGSFLGPFRTSCICSLESCRFDKVKPVRDTVLQALHYWRNLPGQDSPEPSEAGSSNKGDFSNITSVSESGGKDVANRRLGMASSMGRLSNVKKTCQYYVNSQNSKAADWHIEIAVPKSHNLSSSNFHNEESEGSSFTKTSERVSNDDRGMQNIGFEYEPMDDKQECSSVSNLVPDNYETKFVTVSHDCREESSSLKLIERNGHFATEVISSNEKVYSAEVQNQESLDSTVTESSCEIVGECCSQMANEMVCIRKQLMEIESKQSNLMELIEEFTTGIMDSLSTIQSRMAGLEHVVDGLAKDLLQGGRHSDVSSCKVMKHSQSVSSPRLSTCTPRPSLDIRNRKASVVSVKNSSIWDENAIPRSRLSNAARQGTEMWAMEKVAGNPSIKDTQKNEAQGTQNIGGCHVRQMNAIFSSSSCAKTRQNALESKDSLWRCVNSFLCKRDLDSAYKQALYSGDELVLLELLDRTGPVVESLSPKIVTNVLSMLASFLLEHRFTNSIIPWLQQVVDLSTIHGANYLVLSAKERKELLSAFQQAANSEYSNGAERRCMTQITKELRQIWGKCS